MRLGIDAVGAKHGGAAAVTRAVVEAALRHPSISETHAFVSPRGMREFEFRESPKLAEVEVDLAERGPVGRIAWHSMGLARAAARRRLDVLLCLSGGGHGEGRVPSTLLIQQALPFSGEALRTLSWRGRLRMHAIRCMMGISVRRSARIVVQTNTMKSWVSQAFAISESGVTVIEPEAVVVERAMPSPALAEMRAAPSDRLVLYVGNASPYKNLGVLPAAMVKLRERVPGAVLFGTFPEAHKVLREPTIRRLPRLSAAELREAYELASVLVMPSLVETVGLPLLEAAAFGTPVVAANRPYAREVCGGCALFFDPLDPADLAGKLETLLLQGALRSDLRAAGLEAARRRAEARPWERMIGVAIEAAVHAPVPQRPSSVGPGRVQ